jgi:hypothetical protein
VEYASPRFSRISWNSREDMPPPSTALSTDSTKRRGSVAVSPAPPMMTLACSVERRTVTSVPAKGAGIAATPSSPRRGSDATDDVVSHPPASSARSTCAHSASWSTPPAAVTTRVRGP